MHKTVEQGTGALNILVAGGAGYVGSRLVPDLVEKGNKVSVVDLLWFGNNLPANVPVIRDDILNLSEDQLKEFDVVIFLAGLSNDPMAEFSPSHNFIENSAAPTYLAYISKKAGVKRFIYASSASVYGFTDGEPLGEDDPAESSYAYGIAKMIGESGVMYQADEKFSVIALRTGTICGWSPRMRLDLIVNTMYMHAISSGGITVNNPQVWRPILAISDAIKAYNLAIYAPKGLSGVFNILSGNFTVGEIGQRVHAHLRDSGKYKNLELNVKNIPDSRNYKMSGDKARKLLGFEPDGNLDTILRELDQNMSQISNLLDEKYYNIQVFKSTLANR